jgi:hypothetical protein
MRKEREPIDRDWVEANNIGDNIGLLCSSCKETKRRIFQIRLHKCDLIFCKNCMDDILDGLAIVYSEHIKIKAKKKRKQRHRYSYLDN